MTSSPRGNLSDAVVDGGVVRRAAGTWTPTIHRLLTHLRSRGIDWVPEPLGVEGARERVSFLPGIVPGYPLPAWVWREHVLADAARRLAAVHAATADFDSAAPGTRWQVGSHSPAEVVCHNDFAPYNLVFAADEPHALTGVIDWDTASPGPRVWDLAYLAYRLVPLTSPQNPDTGVPAPRRPAERGRRLTALCAHYGPHAPEPQQVLRVAVARLHELADFTAARADADPVARAHLRDHVRVYRADAARLVTGDCLA